MSSFPRFGRLAAAVLVVAAGTATAQQPIRVGDGVSAPERLKAVPPVYPERARSEWIQGVIVLDVTVDPDGTVGDVDVIRSIPALDEAAIAAVRQWEYAPSEVDGEPVSVVMTTSLNFTLPGADEWVVQPEGEPVLQIDDYVVAIEPDGTRRYRGSVSNQTDEPLTGLGVAVLYEEFIPALVEMEGRPEGVEPMEKVRSPLPDYPRDARDDGIQGIVRAQLFVNDKGSVEGLRILRSIPALDPAVYEALYEWSYEPPTYRGAPVAFVAEVEVNFMRGGVSIASESIVNSDIGRAMKRESVELERLEPGASASFALDLELSSGFDVKSPQLIIHTTEDGRMQRVPTRRQKKTIPAS